MMRFIIAAALLLPVSAMAQPTVDEINYHFLEAGYLFTELDTADGDVDGRGFGRFEYSFPIRRHLHLFAGFDSYRYKDITDEDDGKARTKVFGLGTHFNIGNRVSIFGRFAYTDVDLDLGTGTFSDDGGIVTAGVRFMPASGYEIRAHARYRNLDSGGSDTSYGLGGDIFLTDVAALTIDISIGDDENIAMVGGRFYFGQDRRTVARR